MSEDTDRDLSERGRRMEQEYKRKPQSTGSEDEDLPWYCWVSGGCGNTPSPPPEMEILSYSQVDDDAGPESFYFVGKVYREFYAQARWWIFYIERTSPYNFVYRTSTNGTTWSDETLFRNAMGSSYQYLAIWFDGTCFHYAIHGRTYNNPIVYRMGTPNANGTITWLQDEQTVIAGIGDKRYQYLTIVCDSDGYPWIGCYRYSLEAGDRKVYVTKSSTKDGTWTEQSGFPYCPDDVDEVRSRLYFTPLASAQMYIFYDKGASGGEVYPINGRIWTGSWGDQETIVNSSNDRASAVFYNGKIHLVYRDGLNNIFKHIVRNGSWGIPTIVSQDLGLVSLSIDEGTGYLYLWYIDNSIVYWRKYTGTWDSGNTLQNRTGNGPVTPIAFYKVLSDKLGIFWNESTSILGHSGLINV